MSQRILVLGAGFAGLWSALGAARKLDELGLGPERVEVVLVNRDEWHSIRVRNYEADLAGIRVPLSSVFDPVGVRLVQGDVFAIDVERHRVGYRRSEAEAWLDYDRLVVALGSRVARPPVPGLAEYGFDVDTFDGAARLDAHIATLRARDPAEVRFSVAVIGAGLTGIEVATEMTRRLAAVAPDGKRRVVLIDRAPQVGSDMGESARPVIREACESLGIELRMGETVTAVDPNGLRLASGGFLPAATVICCAGMRANPLVGDIPGEHDRFGRVRVEPTMQVAGAADVFAAGDAAWAVIDGVHPSVMSCQHGRPMGRFAGHNAVCHLLGLSMLPLDIGWYVTVLDLGAWGAVYTEGWNRQVIARGEPAKRTKELINRQRIYPPVAGGRSALLAAAAPVVQAPPSNYAGESRNSDALEAVKI